MSVETCIVCDDCGAILSAADTARKAREDIRRSELGVHRRRGKQWVDLCETCDDEDRHYDDDR